MKVAGLQKRPAGLGCSHLGQACRPTAVGLRAQARAAGPLEGIQRSCRPWMQPSGAALQAYVCRPVRLQAYFCRPARADECGRPAGRPAQETCRAWLRPSGAGLQAYVCGPARTDEGGRPPGRPAKGPAGPGCSHLGQACRPTFTVLCVHDLLRQACRRGLQGLALATHSRQKRLQACAR